MSYTTGELAHLLGMTREGVRFMERQGVIHAEVNPQNGYRSFDYDQFVTLKRVKSYRSLGFSLDEAKQMVVTLRRKEILPTYEEKLRELSEKRQELEAVERHLRTQLEAAQSALAGAETFETVTCPALRFYVTMQNRRPYPHPELSAQAQSAHLKRWTQGMPDVKMCACYREDGIELKGSAATEEVFGALALPDCASLLRFPARPCVRGTVDAGVFERPDFTPLRRWAEARGLHLEGDVICLLQLTYRHEDGGLHAIHTFYAPLQDAGSAA